MYDNEDYVPEDINDNVEILQPESEGKSDN